MNTIDPDEVATELHSQRRVAERLQEGRRNELQAY